ncbi:MAG: agmatine deiminase family protein [Deltaproteobacteria bacterium]|nr:agmatine deiminase family protein [Deltaproteobacteria bacterium]
MTATERIPDEHSLRRSSSWYPAEWVPHQACWMAWPHHPDWGDDLLSAKREIVALARAVSDWDVDADVDRGEVEGSSGNVPSRGERVRLLVMNEEAAADARRHLKDTPVDVVIMPYGDIWLRDTLPLFVFAQGTGEELKLKAACFGFNGWGGKYFYEEDGTLATRVAALKDIEVVHSSLFFEGGSIDVDGEGSLLTTRSCLLNDNRNPGWSEQGIERELERCLGAEKVIWLDEGLKNDHTDGHVDTLARFVRPGVVVCMTPKTEEDPNCAALRAIERTLRGTKDARGRSLEVITVPSPGAILDRHGTILPASYMNFYVANTAVVVPTYGSPWDEEAVSALRPLFPNRRVVGSSAKAILTGGGAFHCITQQEPKAEAP